MSNDQCLATNNWQLVTNNPPMLKPSDNPPMLHPAVGSLRELTGQWWVAHTKARNEKAFAWDLADRDVAYYLPMVPRLTFSGGRKRRGLQPLFPSYVFVIGSEQSRDAALRTNRLCNLIEVDDQPKLIDELSSIERILAHGINVDLCPFAQAGQSVKIAQGPFKGIVGQVIRRDSVTKLMLEVSILGRAVEMEIESDLLELAA